MLNISIRYRFFKAIIIVLLTSSAFAETSNLSDLAKQKKYKEIVFHFKTQSTPQTYKDFGYLILAYKNLNDLNKLTLTLEDAIKSFSDKDVLKRELAEAYEKKSLSYIDEKMANLKKEYYLKAYNTLDELKTKKPTANNLTAFINFHMRNEKFNEVEALLDLYSRSYPMGQAYYSILCEVNFKKKLYVEAVESCKNVKDDKDTALLRYVKSKEIVEKSDPDSKSLLNFASRFPASPSVHLEIGKRFLSEGKYENSIYYLKKANDLMPTSEGFRMIAESHFGIQNYRSSLSNFRKACRLETGSKSHIHNKIRLLSKKMPKKDPVYNSFELEISRCKHLR